MALTKASLKNFTAFQQLDVEFSPGINVFIGENGTGKTHLLKVLYTACEITKSRREFAEKLIQVFYPSNQQISRLAYRAKGDTRAKIEVFDGERSISLEFGRKTRSYTTAKVKTQGDWLEKKLNASYIPVKEMLANAPGFRSLVSTRDLHFEGVYQDIIDRAFTPKLMGKAHPTRAKLLKILEGSIEGKVSHANEEFFLSDKQGNLEFTLVAEGIRKLALLWLLIQNGTLWKGSVLFWDEPEANMNPKHLRNIVEILYELQKTGMQIFISTHNYILLKEFQVQKKKQNKVRFHSLFRESGEDKKINHSSTEDYLQIHPNTIVDTYSELYERDQRN